MTTTIGPEPDQGFCPVCEAEYDRRVLSKFGGTIDHSADLAQERTCFWPFDHTDGTEAVAVYYHVDQQADDETIELDDD
jgi:hypothetical protein